MNTMDKYGLTIEEVDAASGRALARSVTATYGTSDLAGTDTLSYAVASHYEIAVDDEMREQWKMPQWILDMVAKGYLGDKAGSGFFREKRTQVFDPATMEYRPRQDPRQPSIAEANKISDPAERVRKFISFDDDAARFGWDLLAATFVYSANRVPEICDDIAQIDRGMRWGYAWDLGPFELWDALGVKETVERMQAEGRAVPDWVVALAAVRRARTSTSEDGASLAAYGPEKRHVPLAPRPRTIVLDDLKRAGKTLDECPAASLIDLGDRVACLEYHTRGNTVTEEVHQFTEKILAAAGRDYDALVIGNQGSHFSGGADLKMMADRIQAGDFAAIDATLRYVQKVTMALKYSPIPVVAAPFGRVLGGGLEVCLHCDRIQAEADVSMGLVETSVGLIPGAGGIKESLLRAMEVLKGVSLAVPLSHAHVRGHSPSQDDRLGLGSVRHELHAAGGRRDHEPGERHLRREADGAADARDRLSTARAGQGEGHGGRRHRQLPQRPLQHGAEPVHLRARPLSGREDRLRAERRRGRSRHRGGRVAPAPSGADGLPGDLPHAQDAGADPGHAWHRQTPSQLGRPAGCSTREIIR